MERTHLRDLERLSKLLALLSLAFCWCYRVGEWRAEQKSIRRLKHKRPAYSVFRYGLDYLNELLLKSSERAMNQKDNANSSRKCNSWIDVEKYLIRGIHAKAFSWAVV